MSDKELRPCPFCGQTPEHEVLINQGYDDPQWWIECPNHNCPVAPGLGDSCRETAKERWNTRTPDPMLEELAVALEEIVRCLSHGLQDCRASIIAKDMLGKYQQSKVEP